MSDQTNEATPQGEEPAKELDINALVQKLQEITNDQGKPKYEDPVKAVDALKHSQDHIKRLEDENRSMREQMDKISEKVSNMATTEDIVAKLSQKLEAPQGQTETPSATEFDGLDLESLINQAIDKRTVQQKAGDNLKEFLQQVANTTNDVEGVIEKAAKANGIGINSFTDIAKQSPSAALKLVGVEPSMPSKPQTQVNTQGLKGTPSTDIPFPSGFNQSKELKSWLGAVRARAEATLKA